MLRPAAKFRNDNGPMPSIDQLTWSGVALHAGALTGEDEATSLRRWPIFGLRALPADTGGNGDEV